MVRVSGTCYVIPNRLESLVIRHVMMATENLSWIFCAADKARSVVKAQPAQWWDPRTWLAFGSHTIFQRVLR